MFAAWRILDPSDIDGTVEAWLVVARSIVFTQHAKSSSLAAAYYSRFRLLEIGETVATLTAPPPAASVVSASLLIEGPWKVRAMSAAGRPLADAVNVGLSESSRVASLHTLNGGRDTIMENVRADKRAGGFTRVTSGNSCDFCTMLADRGAVYRTEPTFEAHKGCNCTAEPAFD